jgi:hypothetical protein
VWEPLHAWVAERVLDDPWVQNAERLESAYERLFFGTDAILDIPHESARETRLTAGGGRLDWYVSAYAGMMPVWAAVWRKWIAYAAWAPPVASALEELGWRLEPPAWEELQELARVTRPHERYLLPTRSGFALVDPTSGAFELDGGRGEQPLEALDWMAREAHERLGGLHADVLSFKVRAIPPSLATHFWEGPAGWECLAHPGGEQALAHLLEHWVFSDRSFTNAEAWLRATARERLSPAEWAAVEIRRRGREHDLLLALASDAPSRSFESPWSDAPELAEAGTEVVASALLGHSGDARLRFAAAGIAGMWTEVPEATWVPVKEVLRDTECAVQSRVVLDLCTVFRMGEDETGELETCLADYCPSLVELFDASPDLVRVLLDRLLDSSCAEVSDGARAAGRFLTARHTARR